MPATSRFAADLESVASARAWLVDQLRHLAPSPLVDDAQLCLSELASNAVNHSGSAFDVEVAELADRVRITVSDASDDQPVVRSADPRHRTGRGLAIVEAVAMRWGVTARTPSGKSVWCELALPGST